MGFTRILFTLMIAFFAASTSQAAETQIVHIRVNGIRITKDLYVPNADYDIKAMTDSSGIIGLHVKGTNDDHWDMDSTFTIAEIRGVEKPFVKTKLPGAPFAFTAKCSDNFSAEKGGVVRLHALSDWKWMWLKHYGYKDFDVQIENEAGTVRASLIDKNKKLQKFSKLTVDIGLIGGSFKIE